MPEKRKNLNKLAIGISLITGILLMLLKFLAYYLTDSKAILTDAVESIVNVAAAAFAWYSLYVAHKPKDLNHPYGYGKMEFFSSGVEGMLILIAGLSMLFPAIFSFFEKTEVQRIEVGILLIAITMIVNGILGYFLLQKGKQNDSMTLIADGKHLLSDSLSSLALVAGLILVKFTGFSFIDGILAIILAIVIIYNGYRILRKSVGGLMDEQDEDTLTKLVEILNKNRRVNWIDVHNLRVQKYGADIHIDCHLTLPWYLNLHDAHEDVSAFEKTVAKNYNSAVEVFIHADPCLPECCHYCQVQNCKVRKDDFTGTKEWNLTRLMTNVKHFEE